MSNFTAIIPARFASTRLPGKPLADINGQPMIAHVIQKAQAAGAKNVIVATDDERVFNVVETYGAIACMTSMHHQSGTERLAEVIDLLKIDDKEIIINVQGDEPLAPPEIIRQLANNLSNSFYSMATLATPITHIEEVFNPNIVKVVRNKQNEALYFSRATVPWYRESFKDINTAQPLVDHGLNLAEINLYRHLGIYAYRAGFIKEYIALEVSPLEQIELLEQLRVLWHGIKIHVDIAEVVPQAGVDTPEDLIRVRQFLSNN